jgi:cytochrome c-type biogenesis protein CcmF
VFHKPFINWLWIGGLLLVIGGFLAASDRRYRIAVKSVAPTGATQGA